MWQARRREGDGVEAPRGGWPQWGLLGLLAWLLTSAQPGGAGEIAIGMSTPLKSGPVALGQSTKLGVETYFEQVNKAGGVNGHTLKLIALDDGYEPAQAAPNMRRLITEEKVLAVIGNVGTPTAVVSVPIANELKTPFLGAVTGAGLLRKSPPDRYIFNYRASYSEETASMIEGLLAIGIQPQEIAFFTQNDGYGDSGYAGGIKALKAKGYAAADQLVHGRYTRNTTHVEGALAAILESAAPPKAIIMVGAYQACAAFIKEARQDLPDTLFINVSFVGSVALAKALGEAGNGVIITQVVPWFYDDLPGVTEYLAALQAFSPSAQPDFLSLEGYLAAKLLVEGIRRSGSVTDREKLVEALEGLREFDLGVGAKASFSRTDHQASHQVWPTLVHDGEFQPFEWEQLK